MHEKITKFLRAVISAVSKNEVSNYIIENFWFHVDLVWIISSMNTDHIKTGNFPNIRLVAFHHLEVNLDVTVTVFGSHDVHTFNDFEHVCHLFTLRSNHVNHTLGTICFVLLLLCSQVMLSTGLAWKPWRKMVWFKFWFLGMIGSGYTTDLLKSIVETLQLCWGAFGLGHGRWAFGREIQLISPQGQYFFFHGCDLSYQLGKNWCKMIQTVYASILLLVRGIVAKCQTTSCFWKTGLGLRLIWEFRCWTVESLLISKYYIFFRDIIEQPDTKVINKLPKPSATRSDVDVAVIDDYTVIFQVPKTFFFILVKDGKGTNKIIFSKFHLQSGLQWCCRGCGCC